jgi:GNAT superfamily N-acetyltransferase
MITLHRTNADNPDFGSLVWLLDAYLAVMDGDEHPFFAQFNKTDQLEHVVVAYEKDIPLGCGALKEFEPGVMEVKRMYVVPDGRRKGVASSVLRALENWAQELMYKKCILETGHRFQDAVGLYEHNGYHRIPNYGQYAGVEASVCFEKALG